MVLPNEMESLISDQAEKLLAGQSFLPSFSIVNSPLISILKNSNYSFKLRSFLFDMQADI